MKDFVFSGTQVITKKKVEKPDMNLVALSKTIRFDNSSKGFDLTEGGLERYLMLVCSEICEAHEELRDGHGTNEIYFNTFNDGRGEIPSDKPEGFPVEIADAIIRILDIQAHLDLNIQLIPGRYEFDTTVGIEKELLAVVSTVSSIFRDMANFPQIEAKLNLALSALFQIAMNLNIDIHAVIHQKLAYNRTRPPKHGRKF